MAAILDDVTGPQKRQAIICISSYVSHHRLSIKVKSFQNIVTTRNPRGSINPPPWYHGGRVTFFVCPRVKCFRNILTQQNPKGVVHQPPPDLLVLHWECDFACTSDGYLQRYQGI